MLSTLFLGPSQVPLWGWHVLHTHACMADVGTAGLFEISAWWRTAQGHRIERDPCHPDRKDGEGVIEPKRGAYALPQARHGGGLGSQGRSATLSAPEGPIIADGPANTYT